MAQLSARQTALAALQRWRRQKRFADSVASNLLTECNFSSHDRGFFLELFYGVLRNLTLLDFWIGCLRSSHIGNDVRDILRLGLYQLFLLKTAQYAAVHETVELAAKKTRPIINGVLRAATRQREELLALANAQSLSVRRSHPKFLIERWNEHFGADCTEELCKWNNLAPPIYARINRLKISAVEFLRIYPTCRPLPANFEFVEFDALPSSALTRGHCYVQDPSTAIACDILDPKPDQRVLDACAAPGGKTGYIAQLMNNQGVIVACDRDAERLSSLDQNMSRLGVKIARIVPHDWTGDHIPLEIASLAPFDRVLLDAPCSNTGVMRRRVDVRWRLTPADFDRMAKRQIAIARAVFGLLKPGAVLVYSTCSLEPEENANVVDQILRIFPVLRLSKTKQSLPFREHFDGAFAAKLVRATA